MLRLVVKAVRSVAGPVTPTAVAAHGMAVEWRRIGLTVEDSLDALTCLLHDEGCEFSQASNCEFVPASLRPEIPAELERAWADIASR